MKTPTRTTLRAALLGIGATTLLGLGGGCSGGAKAPLPGPDRANEAPTWFPRDPVSHAAEPGVSEDLHTLIFPPDGDTLISASDSGGIKVWDLRKQGDSACVKHFRPAGSRAVALHPDGRTLGVVADIEPAYLIDLDSPAGDDRVESHARGYLLGMHTGGVALAFAPDGKALAALNTRGGLAVWEAAFRGLAKDATLESSWYESRYELQHGGKGFAFRPDGAVVAVTGKRVELLDVKTGKVVTTCEESQQAGRLAFSPDGRTLAAGGSTLRLWNGKTGASEKALPVKGEVIALAFSPDGKTIACWCDGHEEKTDNGVEIVGAHIELYDLSRGKVRQSIRGGFSRLGDSIPPAFAFSRDGGVLATGRAGGRIDFWDVRPKE